MLATTSDQFFTNANEPQRLKIEALMYSFGLSHFQRATLGARRRPPPPHLPPPLTSIAADSGRYILQTVEVSGRFAKRHLGSSSRSRQLQRSPSPVDGLQSCSFVFFSSFWKKRLSTNSDRISRLLGTRRLLAGLQLRKCLDEHRFLQMTQTAAGRKQGVGFSAPLSAKSLA